MSVPAGRLSNHAREGEPAESPPAGRGGDGPGGALTRLVHGVNIGVSGSFPPSVNDRVPSNVKADFGLRTWT